MILKGRLNECMSKEISERIDKVDVVDGSENNNGRIVAYRGPLPPAQELERYEQVAPGSADRIIRMAEEQQGHRHKIEDRTVWFMSVQSFLAPVFAFLTIIFGMALGGYLLIHGITGWGVAAMFGPLATVASVFVYQKAREPKGAEED
jgi:uncharacterized membrane protein